VKEEWFDLVTAEGDIIGKALRSECHGNPDLLHQAVHVFVVHPETGDLFLQQRSHRKDIQPGKWDTSVGGHVDSGEPAADAAVRELREELGLDHGPPEFMYRYLWNSPVESELIRSYRIHHAGPFTLQPEELDDGRFWTLTEIESHLGTDLFTPNFESEWTRIRPYLVRA
jgi:isopentenyldiphosphate isomerase